MSEPLRVATLGLAPGNGMGVAYLFSALETASGVKLGENGLPIEILLWRDGATKTTKGTFNLTDRARKLVLDDWAARMGAAVSPTGDGPGAFDYDHDEFNERLPGYEKIAAGSFDLALDGKDIWQTNCRFTARAADQIKAKEKRSTSGAFHFDPKTGEFTSLINVALTNLPATYNQAILCNQRPQGLGYVLAPPDGPQEERRIIVQVPAIVLPGELPEAQQKALSSALDLLGQGKLEDAGRALLAEAPKPQPVTPPEPVEPPLTVELLGVVHHEKFPPHKSTSWDGAAVEKAARKFASSDGSGDWDKVNRKTYAKFFAYVKNKGEHPSDYLLPHHNIVGGKIVSDEKGVEAAGGSIQGSHGQPPAIPAADLPAVKKHLEAEYHLFDRKAPWEPKEKTSAAPAPAAVAPLKSSQRTGMYPHIDLPISNPHDMMKARLRHLGEAFPYMHKLRHLAAEHGHEDLAKHYGEHIEKMAKHAEHLGKHAAKLGETLDALAQTSDALPAPIAEMLPHHAMSEAMRMCGDGMMLDKALKHHAEKAGHADAVDGYEEHMKHGAEHLKHLADHLMRHPMHADAMSSILSARPEALVKRVMGALSVKAEVEIIPAITDQQELLRRAKAAALSAGSIAQADVTAACDAAITKLCAGDDPLMSPATAQLAKGLDPATGKPSGLPRWSLAEIDAFEKRHKESRGQLSAHLGTPIVKPPTATPAPVQGAVDPKLAPAAQLAQGEEFELFKAMNPEITDEAKLKETFLASLNGTHSFVQKPGPAGLASE